MSPDIVARAMDLALLADIFGYEVAADAHLIGAALALFAFVMLYPWQRSDRTLFLHR